MAGNGTTNERSLASYDLSTEEGYRAWVKLVEQRFQSIYNVLMLVADDLYRRLSKTPTQGNPDASARKEAAKVRRRMHVAAFAVRTSARAVLKAFQIFEATYPPKTGSQAHGMKLGSNTKSVA